MNAAAVTTSPITHLVPVATWTAGAMAAGKTGASHLSMKSRPPKGALISQPMVEATARMIRGIVMTGGASCGAPCGVGSLVRRSVTGSSSSASGDGVGSDPWTGTVAGTGAVPPRGPAFSSQRASPTKTSATWRLM